MINDSPAELIDLLYLMSVRLCDCAALYISGDDVGAADQQKMGYEIWKFGGVEVSWLLYMAVAVSPLYFLFSSFSLTFLVLLN
jgi:hypothetical protein